MPYPSLALWHWDNSVLVLLLLLLHLMSWLSIACSIFTIDYLELLGIKQVCVCVCVWGGGGGGMWG
jgi:hypothetical protein